MASGKNELTCPFCGQLFDDQDLLTDHFSTKHQMAEF